ncbi:hypothetical protein RJT34_03041 [Clitoria ternatea]|uniref:Uncharacterized protein n=1 Tax=Clitoria ternatea TaxID=43366 RepID=A0AAN9KJ25_CLITE
MDNSSSVVFHDTAHHNNNNKLQPSDSDSSNDPNLHMTGLGLSSQPMDWNQPSLFNATLTLANEPALTLARHVHAPTETILIPFWTNGVA